MAELTTDVRYIKGVGEQRAKALGRLGVHTLGDLVAYFPRGYEDRRETRTIDALRPGETACVRAMVAAQPRLARVRKGLDLVKLRAVDDTGALEITYFNQSYVRNQLLPGESYVFYGKVGGDAARRTMINPVWEKETAAGAVTGRIMPLYHLTAGLSDRQFARMVTCGLEACGDILPEVLPEDVREARQLARAGFAYRNVHFPADEAALALARRRLFFEAMFVRFCAMDLLRENRRRAPGPVFPAVDWEEFYAALPFAPTGAQRRAVAEAAADMASGTGMNRLVQGDVGSGKTLVAAACAWLAWKSGWQSAFMAPTEILAGQHLRTLESLLAPLGMRVGLLTGSLAAKARREAKALLADGGYDLMIGTHALLTEDVKFRRLGLVITDEQHRFGVDQRSALTGKGERPHVLVMSATPIPRTLALYLYGDLDVSVIDELPPGRRRVETFAVDESYRERLNGFIRKQVSAGRQVFVVCPMVEENDELPLDLVSATERAETLRLTFPEARVGCIHGRLKPKDKDAAMAAFAAGETDILVATTVVEVGVDVPNASLMVVENAERFGLSQLHQLRGRVGRGAYQSYCVLVSDAVSDPARAGEKARLDVLCRTADGFAVAEADLRLRGPGDFLGSQQHGQFGVRFAALRPDEPNDDMDVLREARESARSLLRGDPGLRSPGHAPLLAHIRGLFELKADTLN